MDDNAAEGDAPQADPQEPPAEYVPVLGAATIAAGITEKDTMIQILWWIGFRVNAQTTLIYDDGVDGWENILMLSTDDIDAMAKTFTSRTIVGGRIVFGTNRTKWLKAILHWVQDFYRVSATPTIVDLNETTFKAALRTAESRDKIRNTLRKNNIPSDASPGPLEKESKWKEWEEKFLNYLRLHLGSSGIPLSYVVRDNDDPDTTTEQPEFINKTVACAPLNGEHFDADKLTVFNFIVSFTTGQPSGDWVKDTVRFSNGRRSMKALRDHFLGEGNATRSLASAEGLRSSLRYVNERSMAFETFLTQCQRMFNIFKQENEPMSEEAKIRFLFQSIQHKDLLVAVEALRAQQTTGSNLTYTACCNHLTTAVSQLPEYIQRNRSISGVKIGAVKTVASIYKDDGTINATGTIKDWDTIPMSEKRLVYKERKRLGIKFGSNQSGGRGHNKGNYNNNANVNASNSNTITQLRKQNNTLKRKIKSLKQSNPSDDKNEEVDDAGDEFGGKKSKKKKQDNS
jgi:hypothetical protein